MKELKACPFCGNIPIISVVHETSHLGGHSIKDRYKYTVSCALCGYSLSSENSDDVERKWNTRVE